MTAGNGRDGAGEAERRTDGEVPKDDRRLRDVGGGFMGSARLCGVPGIDGTGEPMLCNGWSPTKDARPLKSGGAGLLDEIRLE